MCDIYVCQYKYDLTGASMTLALLGPCMLVAPLVVVAMVIAIPLWPVAIVVTAGCWAFAAAGEALLTLLGVHVLDGWELAMRRVLLLVLTPWSYFDPKRPASPPDA
jgi:hypothetical protein